MPDSFATPWSVVLPAPLSVGFPRQEYWSGLPFPPPGGLPNPGLEPMSPCIANGFFPTARAGFKSCLCSFLALWPWESHWSSPGKGGRSLKGSLSRLESGKCLGHSGLSGNKSCCQGPGGSRPRWFLSPLQKIARINKQLLCYHPELPIRLGA